jgi:hypothetical protein
MTRRLPSRSYLMLGSALLLAACGAHRGGSGATPAPGSSPAAVAAELLATDSAFAEAGGTLPVVEALAPMFAEDVEMPSPGGFIMGRDSVLKALRSNPVNLTAKFPWTPIRVGVSADGRHGFTFGYGTLVRPDP